MILEAFIFCSFDSIDNRTFILRQLGTNGVISYILAPGQERTVCAIENSVSVAEGGYGNISKRSVCGTTPTNSSQITPTTQTNPNIAQTVVTGGGSTRYVAPGLDGTTNSYNGFDNRGLYNVENDPTGRDY